MFGERVGEPYKQIQALYTDYMKVPWKGNELFLSSLFNQADLNIKEMNVT